jgi:hypothetical protein
MSWKLGFGRLRSKTFYRRGAESAEKGFTKFTEVVSQKKKRDSRRSLRLGGKRSCSQIYLCLPENSALSIEIRGNFSRAR